MRYGLMLTAALAAMSTTSAHADDEWCGYATGDKALIECGYSSVAQCENAVGKGGVCFVDPEYALQTKRSHKGGSTQILSRTLMAASAN